MNRLAVTIASRAVLLVVSSVVLPASAQMKGSGADHASAIARAFPSISSITDGHYDDRQARYSPDGKRLVFTSTRGKKSHIFIMPAGGGEATRVTPLEYSAWQPAWSPDGARIAFESDRDGNNGIWAMPASGGEAVRLTPDSMTASWPDWSPDGTKIAFISNQSGNWNIYAMPVAGGKPQQITQHKENEWNPRWSPEGDHIAFYTTWDGLMTDIWVVPAEGGEPRQITDDPAEDFQPAWSPDGKWLAFFSRRGRHTNLWATPAKGGIARPLTDDWIIYKAWPDWSPDGHAIVYTTFPVTHLFSMPVTGGTPSQLTEGERFEQNPVFSPDAKHVLFSSDWFSAEEKLTVMDMSTKKAYSLAHDNEKPASPVLQRIPAWSRDGSTIAFVQSTGGYLDSNNLWIVPAAGGTPRQLTHTGYVRHPVWCEDDRSIAFASKGHIWKIAVHDDTLVQLTQGPGNYTPTDYSPEHKQIIFHQPENGADQLFLLPVNGGSPQPFKTALTSSQNARWSPDGSLLVFASDHQGQYDLYLMPAAGGTATRLTKSEGRESLPAWSPDGKTLLYSMPFDHMKICTASADSLSHMLK
ncbi:MAG: DPP IV N-terminal domain-containing protein [bacterium]